MVEHSVAFSSISGYRPIFERLLDDVAFLWLQRSQAEDRATYFEWDLAAMDARIQHYLRALQQAPDIVWKLFEESGDNADTGCFFAVAVLSFHRQNTKNIKRLVEFSAHNRDCAWGITSALACLPGALVHPWIKKFLISKNRHYQYLALQACYVRREDPRAYLTALIQQADNHAHEDLYVCALKLAGALKRMDLLPQLRNAMADDRESVQSWAAWACALLKDTTAVPVLQRSAFANDGWSQEALANLLLLTDFEQARALVDELARNDATRKQAVAGCAVLGDAGALPWLLQVAQSPSFTREATHAVVTITGIVPDSDWLKNSSVESTADDSDTVSDWNEELPLIDPDKLLVAWRQNSSRWEPGRRYFLGQPLQAEHLQNLYPQANQRHRRAVALHLAALLPDRPLLNHARAEPFRL